MKAGTESAKSHQTLKQTRAQEGINETGKLEGIQNRQADGNLVK